MIFTCSSFIGLIPDAQCNLNEASVPQSSPSLSPTNKVLKCWTSVPFGGFLGHIEELF